MHILYENAKTAPKRRTAYVPGATISRTDERVEIVTHLSEPGVTSFSMGAFQLPSPCLAYISL